MAATTLAVLAGTAAAAAWADAKYHLRHDLARGHPDRAAADSLAFIAERWQQKRPLVYHDIEKWAKLDKPGHSFLLFEGRSWTYKQFFADLQRVGNWLMHDLGIAPGEMVALNGPNTAEWVLLWHALEGIGAKESFINHNLTGASLSHCIKLCKPRIVLADRDTTERIEPCRKELEEQGIRIVYYDEAFFKTLHDTTPIPSERTAGIKPDDIRALIYTSGTTGLPKGVIMPTGRSVNASRTFANLLKLKQEDRFYTCLPLYHAAAQGLAFSPSIHAGASVCLGRKFSQRTFWPEVAGSKATIVQYVGELCRYLVNSTPHPLERQHNVRMAWGNGMRADVWERFRERFNIAVIHELYAATDGLNASFNANQGAFSRGAIGVRGKIWDHIMGDREVRARIDPDTEELMRTPDGRAVRSAVGEPGEVLMKVDPALKPAMFRGYFENAASTEKRWMQDVFEKGDLWFRSGDVLRQDADGRLYFVDRLGDTFRWKSENVSTNEVADVLGEHPQLAEVSVYGVSVPNADGRCGCATVVLQAGVDVAALDRAKLAAHVRARLPRYAVPVFLRVTPELNYTGTFKIQKGQAKREGIDLDLIEKSGSKDVVLWLPPGAEQYEPYRREDWAALRSGQLKL